MTVKIPKAYEFLFYPKRYKVLYGGRAAGKSHAIARALLVLSLQSPLRILCAREIQNSISDSVHKLLSDVIHEHGFDDYFKIQANSIEGNNGSLFIFKGLKHNIASIRSTEGIDIAWVEEAETVSDNSWEVLIPTIRKAGSEVWVSFNPRYPTDPTYTRFVRDADPSSSVVKKVSYRDNPFLSQTILDDIEKTKSSNIKAFDFIYEGNFDKRFMGAVYAQEIEQLRASNKITSVPYDPLHPVYTSWDLGYGDSTSIWFAQRIGYETRLIDFYENSGQRIDHYIHLLREKGYKYATHFIPHDGAFGRLESDSISSILTSAGLPHKVLPREQSIKPALEKSRLFLASCVFDKAKTEAGLHALSHYQFEYDQDRKIFKDSPRHDWTSHAADSFRYLVRGLSDTVVIEKPVPKFNKPRMSHGSGNGWLAV